MTEPRSLALPGHEQSTLLAQQWRLLGRAATLVAVLTSPAVFLYLHKQQGWGIGWSIVLSIVAIAAFRGFVDLILRRVIPWPSLFGTDDPRLREEDVVNRRRASFWGFWWKVVRLFLIIVLLVVIMRSFLRGWEAANPWATTQDVGSWMWHLRESFRSFASYGLILPFFFIFNFLILMGPMLLMGITQIHGFEPGDADWGVRLEDVRGQKEAKEEVRRIVSLWQSGQQFEAAGGKRERGLLFLGAPGTGKTMLAKAIATGFQLSLHLDPRLRLRADVHGHGRDHRPLPRAQGQEARGEMGRPVHHLHRRNRRRRPAPIGRRRVDGATVARGLPLLRADRRAQSERRHDPRDARLARQAVRGARAGAAGLPRRSCSASSTRASPAE